MVIHNRTHIVMMWSRMMLHVMTHILTLWAVASMNRATSHTVQTLHFHSVTHILTNSATAVMTMIVMSNSLWSWSRYWTVVTMVVIISESSSCENCHHCCEYESLESSHNLLVFVSPSGLWFILVLMLQISGLFARLQR